MTFVYALFWNQTKPLFYYLHNLINRLIFNSHKRFKGSKTKAVKWLRFITKSYSNLFYHLEFEVHTGLNLFRLYRVYNKSRMNQEVYVRFCERFRGEIPLYLLDKQIFFFSNNSKNVLVKNNNFHHYQMFSSQSLF
jgi:hypothetical protein